jgi:hypothetical protein
MTKGECEAAILPNTMLVLATEVEECVVVRAGRESRKIRIVCCARTSYMGSVIATTNESAASAPP